MLTERCLPLVARRGTELASIGRCFALGPESTKLRPIVDAIWSHQHHFPLWRLAPVAGPAQSGPHRCFAPAPRLGDRSSNPSSGVCWGVLPSHDVESLRTRRFRTKYSRFRTKFSRGSRLLLRGEASETAGLGPILERMAVWRFSRLATLGPRRCTSCKRRKTLSTDSNDERWRSTWYQGCGRWYELGRCLSVHCHNP